MEELQQIIYNTNNILFPSTPTIKPSQIPQYSPLKTEILLDLSTLLSNVKNIFTEDQISSKQQGLYLSQSFFQYHNIESPFEDTITQNCSQNYKNIQNSQQQPQQKYAQNFKSLSFLNNKQIQQKPNLSLQPKIQQQSQSEPNFTSDENQLKSIFQEINEGQITQQNININHNEEEDDNNNNFQNIILNSKQNLQEEPNNNNIDNNSTTSQSDQQPYPKLTRNGQIIEEYYNTISEDKKLDSMNYPSSSNNQNGRKIKDKPMELKILAWIQEQIDLGQESQITQKKVRKMARKLSSFPEQFRGSKMWFWGFVQRSRLQKMFSQPEEIRIKKIDIDFNMN